MASKRSQPSNDNTSNNSGSTMPFPVTKASTLFEMQSERAPDGWRAIAKIRDAYPKMKNAEKGLFRIVGMNICYWMTSTSGGRWDLASDYFIVHE